jgi:hypothetical protein
MVTMICTHHDMMSDDDYFAKEYSFFAHFNRIAMQRGDKACWTVHYRGGCYPAIEIDFQVPVKTRYNPGGPQPRATLRGKARKLIYKGSAIVLS